MKVTFAEDSLFAFLVLVEAISYVLLPDPGSPVYNFRDSMGNLSLGAGNSLIGFALKGLLFEMYVIGYQISPFRIKANAVAWIVLILLNDLHFYWVHRANHKVRILWASHVNHHSSQRFNLTTAVRQSWTVDLTDPLSLPLVLLGFSPAMLFTVFIIANLYMFPIHTRRISKLWGPIEFLMNTPSHHRVHHATNPQYIDKNFAGMFIFWDRMFGTFAAEVEPVVYVNGFNIDTYNVFVLAFHEYASIVRDLRAFRSLRCWLGILFLSPGWSADLTGGLTAPRSNPYEISASTRAVTGSAAGP
jgi:sterol desaturase/sphingolipid hydroxylase (fatty acid hydroxylase superfamily)